jgi:glutaredoxin
MMVELFTQKTCRPCMELKIFMRGHNIQFQERYIDSDEVAKADFDALGLMGTPAIRIDGKVYTGNTPETKDALLGYWATK